MSRRLATILALVAAPILAACGSSTEPEAMWVDETRTFVLRQVAGKEIPAVIIDNEWSRIGVLSDTLYLGVDGTGTHVMRVSVAPRGEDAREERWESNLRYKIQGDRIELSFVCPPDPISSCIAPPHYRGRLSGAELHMDHALGYPTPLVYQMVGLTD